MSGKLFGQHSKIVYPSRKKLIKPSKSSVPETGKEHPAHQCLLILPIHHDLLVMTYVVGRVWAAVIDVKLFLAKLFRWQGILYSLSKGRSMVSPQSFSRELYSGSAINPFIINSWINYFPQVLLCLIWWPASFRLCHPTPLAVPNSGPWGYLSLSNCCPIDFRLSTF